MAMAYHHTLQINPSLKPQRKPEYAGSVLTRVRLSPLVISKPLRTIVRANWLIFPLTFWTLQDAVKLVSGLIMKGPEGIIRCWAW